MPRGISDESESRVTQFQKITHIRIFFWAIAIFNASQYCNALKSVNILFLVIAIGQQSKNQIANLAIKYGGRSRK